MAWAAHAGVTWLPLTALLLAAWGASTWSQTPAQQVRLIAAAPRETAVVVGLNASAMYAGIALGTALGGVLLPAGPAAALAVHAALAVASLGYLLATRRHR
ncbi:hypothetical protein JYK22_06815, partial [Nonomuraea sp. RK-328]|nr:hypothetical protein [Nonomuraea sp. RK-328]